MHSRIKICPYNWINPSSKNLPKMKEIADCKDYGANGTLNEPLCCCCVVQSDTEKLKGLPVTPFMDRDKVSKPSSQTNFIRFVLLPLFTELTKLFPCLEVKYRHGFTLLIQCRGQIVLIHPTLIE